MTFDDLLDDCNSRFNYIENHLNDAIEEIAVDVDWADACEAIESVTAADVCMDFARHLCAMPESERDTPHHRRVWESNWHRAIDGFQRAIDSVAQSEEDAAGDDEVGDALRSAYESTTFYPTSNQTVFPVAFTGREVGIGTGLAEDCTTSIPGNRRIRVAANRVAMQYDIEIDDTDCDTLENAANAIRSAISELEAV